MNHITLVNTQSVGSFHNSLKLEIKKKRGVFTEKKMVFKKKFYSLIAKRNHDSKVEIIIRKI